MSEILSDTSHIPLGQTIANMSVGHAYVIMDVSFLQKLSELLTKASIGSHRMTVTFPQQNSLCEPVYHDQTGSLPVLLVLG